MFLDVSTELLRAGYSIRFRPGGHSMHPTIRDGEAVTVEPVNALAVKRGDILLYQTERGVIAHRVRSIKKNGNAAKVFILRGDTSISCDEPVKADQILGKIISVERNGRKVDISSRVSKLFRTVRASTSQIKYILICRMSFGVSSLFKSK